MYRHIGRPDWFLRLGILLVLSCAVNLFCPEVDNWPLSISVYSCCLRIFFMMNCHLFGRTLVMLKHARNIEFRHFFADLLSRLIYTLQNRLFGPPIYMALFSAIRLLHFHREECSTWILSWCRQDGCPLLILFSLMIALKLSLTFNSTSETQFLHQHCTEPGQEGSCSNCF